MRMGTGTSDVVVCAQAQEGAAVAREVLGRRRAHAALVVDVGRANWDAVPPADRPPAHVVFVASTRRELGRLLAAASAPGPTRTVSVVTTADDIASGAGPLALRHPIRHVVSTRHKVRRRGGERLTVELAKRLPPRSVLAAVAVDGGPAARGVGCGGLQVAVAGPAAYPWVYGDPRAALVRRDDLSDLADRLGPSVDVLLVDPAWEEVQARSRLEEEAARIGTIVAAVGPRQTSDERPATVRVGGLPPVDLHVCNPMGFLTATEDEYAALPTAPDAESLRARAAELAPGAVDLRPRPGGRPLSTADIAALRPVRAVVDDPSWHAGTWQRAALLTQLSAAGVPVLAGPPDDATAELLGPALTQALAGVSAELLADPVARERHSVVVRRAALSTHGPERRWADVRRALRIPSRPSRTVSVVLVTNRPGYLAHSLGQIAGQDHPSFEVVLGLHGEAFDDGIETAAAQLLGDVPLTVVRASGDTRFGDLLNAAVDASSGALVTKMDDDDWYGPEHLTDLELAWAYSRATLVGKAAEFVHLSGLGITVRRFEGGAEAWNDRIAGGTLMIARSDLEAAGGWRRARRAVDRRLIDDVQAVGGQVYRTHGFGFVLARHDDGHTWDMGLGYFLRQSGMQVRGLALDTAGVQVA